MHPDKAPRESVAFLGPLSADAPASSASHADGCVRIAALQHQGSVGLAVLERLPVRAGRIQVRDANVGSVTHKFERPSNLPYNHFRDLQWWCNEEK